MGRRRLVSLVVAIATAAAVVAACGSESGSRNTERPLTQNEAARLANALFDNFERVGASFVYTGQIGDDTLRLEGDIDFVAHQGRAIVTATGPERAIAEVVWSDAQVIERIPSLPAALGADGSLDVGPFEWVIRQPRIDERELDSALAVITGLASERRDNPQLILQQEGSAYLRTQSFRGGQVDVLRYGLTTSYWVSTRTDEVLRFEGNNSTGTRPRIVDLADRGDRTIEAPPREWVITVDEIGDVYDSARNT